MYDRYAEEDIEYSEPDYQAYDDIRIQYISDSGKLYSTELDDFDKMLDDLDDDGDYVKCCPEPVFEEDIEDVRATDEELLIEEQDDHLIIDDMFKPRQTPTPEQEIKEDSGYYLGLGLPNLSPPPNLTNE